MLQGHRHTSANKSLAAHDLRRDIRRFVQDRCQTETASGCREASVIEEAARASMVHQEPGAACLSPQLHAAGCSPARKYSTRAATRWRGEEGCMVLECGHWGRQVSAQL